MKEHLFFFRSRNVYTIYTTAVSFTLQLFPPKISNFITVSMYELEPDVDQSSYGKREGDK